LTWLQQFIDAILEAFGTLGTTILTFIKDGFVTLFLETTEDATTHAVTITGVAPLGLFMFLTIGISLVIGLTTLVFRIMRNKGKL